MSVTGSWSASLLVAVAVTVWFVVGLAGASETVAVGRWFAPTVAESLVVAPSTVPSFGVTVTVIASPLFPFPGTYRLRRARRSYSLR